MLYCAEALGHAYTHHMLTTCQEHAMSPTVDDIIAELKALTPDDTGIYRFYQLNAQLTQLLGPTQAMSVLMQDVFSAVGPDRAHAFLAALQRNVGAQRAKDLVDQADAEPDPKRAIKLLQRALKDGGTGIQAGKAYQSLGSRYEELGDSKRAIECYTKAIEGGVPNAFSYFWRGQLYFQRGERDSAQRDFEQALALGLSSPEHETAEEYLEQLRQ
jgi:tetratricopeptide (TPR) repeat protein